MAITTDCSFSRFPAEIFTQIVTFLTVREYARLSRVSKSIPPLEEMPFFLGQKALELRLNIPDTDQKLVELFKNTRGVIRGLQSFLSHQQKCSEFRSWIELVIRRNQISLFRSLLDGSVFEIDSVEIREPEQRKGPLFPKKQPISQGEFYSAFIYAASHGHSGCLQEMIEHPWFDEFDYPDLANITFKVASRGHADCLRLLLSSKRSAELATSIATIASNAVEKGHLDCLQQLMWDERFQETLQERCLSLMNDAVENGRTACLKFLVVEGGVDEITPDDFGKMACEAAIRGYRGCLDVLTRCQNFDLISQQLLGRIFIKAAFCGQKGSLTLILTCGRFHEIDRRDLNEAFEKARLEGKDKALIKAFKENKVLTHTSLKTLGKVISVLAKKGRWLVYLKTYLE